MSKAQRLEQALNKIGAIKYELTVHQMALLVDGIREIAAVQNELLEDENKEVETE